MWSIGVRCTIHTRSECCSFDCILHLAFDGEKGNRFITRVIILNLQFLSFAHIFRDKHQKYEQTWNEAVLLGDNSMFEEMAEEVLEEYRYTLMLRSEFMNSFQKRSR